MATAALPTAARPAGATDPRVEAFCAPAGPPVFSGVVHGNQVWLPDPFDVETVHADARDEFLRLLNRAGAADPPPAGKTLLLLGEAGSGKTHLMRAFRSAVHACGGGYCGYLQMNTRADNYARYILSNLVDSLEQPYKPGGPETGLARLARGLLDAIDLVPEGDRRLLTDDRDLEPADTARLVHRLAYAAVQDPRFKGIDIDVVRGVLFVLANDARMHALALTWLRCEDLGRFDRELLGDLVPRPQPEMPARNLVALGRLMRAVHDAALVLLVDQIDQVMDLDRAGEEQGEQLRFSAAAVLDVADKLPNAVVVVGCIEDLYRIHRQKLPRWMLDRLERDPGAVRLSGKLRPEAIGQVLARRLEVFFEAVGVPPDPANPIAPYSPADLGRLSGLQLRELLGLCLQHREQCVRSGWVTLDRVDVGTPLKGKSAEVISAGWEQRWNEFHKSYTAPPLADEPTLGELLAFAVRTASEEMPNGVHFGADPDGRFVPVEAHGPGNAVDKLLVAVCERNARGNGLKAQITEVERRAGEIPAVFVRSTPFPSSPGAEVSKLLTRLVAPRGKGRRVVVENAEWRAMAAFREFHARHRGAPGFAAWQAADRPLGQLHAVSAVLALDKLLAAPPVAPPVPKAAPLPAGVSKPPTPAAPPPAPPAPARHSPPAVRLGRTRGSIPAPVELSPRSLCRHMAYIGGSGSGKTSAAFAVVEHLLLSGVPVVMLDRKGDLARYADPVAWSAAEPDPERAARRDRLRSAVDVRLYTPGADNGRPLAIPVVPPDLGQATAADREQLAQFAAAALGGMMGYKSRNPDPKFVILQKAMEVLAAVPGRAVTVKALQRVVADQDDALTAAFDGQYEGKLFRTLARDLLTLSLRHRRLLEGADTLDMDALLGRGPAAVPGKTRLSVVSTQFLGDAGTTDFWVSQFLLAADRWRAKNPAPDGVLQAVLLFDEADQYLPAVGKPATKGPMESLLKRARSAGIGIFLSTQSPGDFDYRCRDQVLTWLIGRVKEPVAIGKLKPMLEARPGAADRLADQKAGEFYLVREADVLPVLTDRSLMPTEQLSEDRVLEVSQLAGGAAAGV